MRGFVATLMVLVLTMALLPLQMPFAQHNEPSHAATILSDAGMQNIESGCCDMPMNAMHHAGAHCFLDCPVFAYHSGIYFDAHAVRYPNVANDRLVSETASAHFRPPIFI
ncbi:hypothetical protein [Ahrensia marina]|uniref:Uncharacterized protein n=1 Tax=Ahrensia marina TaxID=1514904 RepID=A0A0N0VLI8_9HYPH|nr:hypothetical protein [Ahrensia marina]KPB01341.1 hypothetical protein SU32_08785 [Ahrensia marina]